MMETEIILKNQLTYCIYCNKECNTLTDEHIIPLGLGGTQILKKSSCIDCNVITSKFENFILRGHWLGIRKKLNTGSRRKNRPQAQIIANVIQYNGNKIAGYVPGEECIFHLVFVLFEPEILSEEIKGQNKPYVQNINFMLIGEGGPKFLTLANGTKRKIYEWEKVEYLTHEFTSDNFFKFLAKIAHSYVIKEKGVFACKTYFLPEIILGDTINAMKYVGNASPLVQGIRLKKIDKFHSLEIIQTRKYLTVLIQLFNINYLDVQPIYQVVVGEV